MNNRDQLIQYLSQLAIRTAGGDVVWSEINPSTYVWKSQRNGVTSAVAIQRASANAFELLSTKDGWNYLLTVTENAGEQGAKAKQILAITSSEKSELKDVLREIYAVAQDSSERQAVFILKGLLS